VELKHARLSRRERRWVKVFLPFLGFVDSAGHGLQKFAELNILAVTIDRQVFCVWPERVFQVIDLPAMTQIVDDEIRLAAQTPNKRLPASEQDGRD
jgi:hypothetical protein